ncbi:MAG: hypothetical protein ACTSO6_14315, partial [Promethearchaeota archaeon]
LNHKKYERVLKTTRDLFPKFLHSVYKEYYSVNYAITSEDIDRFIEKFVKVEGFPFTADDLKQFLNSCEKIEVSDEAKVAEDCRNAFEMYSTIFDGFRQFIEGDLGGI